MKYSQIIFYTTAHSNSDLNVCKSGSNHSLKYSLVKFAVKELDVITKIYAIFSKIFFHFNYVLSDLRRLAVYHPCLHQTASSSRRLPSVPATQIISPSIPATHICK